MSVDSDNESEMPRLIATLIAATAAFAPGEVTAQVLAPGDVDLADVVATRNVDYVAEREYADGRDRLDVFMPNDARSVPVVVFFHGGALRAGGKIDGEALAARLVPAGIGVVSANYPLSPGVMHPAHIEDVAAAYAWVIRNIERFGGDAENVYVSGHSAGAYLAALLALDETHLARQGIAFHAVRGAILIGAFLYVEETARDRPKDVWGDDPSGWVRASVTPHIRPDRRPLLLLYADGDDGWRKDQNERFAGAMRAVGNAYVTVLEASNRDHTGLISALLEDDDEIQDAVVDFVQAVGAN